MPKPPGKSAKAWVSFHEVEFAGEEVVEVDELWVAVDGLVRVLLEGETDVETEAVRAASASLRGAHDALAAAGDDHVIVRHHLAREFFRDFVLRFTGRRARRSKNADLARLTVSGENFCGVTHFLQGPVHELQVAGAHFVARHLERGDDHLFDQLWRFFRAPISHELPHARVKERIDRWLPSRGLIVHRACHEIFHLRVSAERGSSARE